MLPARWPRMPAWVRAVQLVTAAVLGSGATALWHFKRARAPRSAPAESNRDVNLDVGEHIRVSGMGRSATSRVEYRGSLLDRAVSRPRPAPSR